MQPIPQNCLITYPEFNNNDLQIFVDASPIGGFRGNAGTIQLQHREGKAFQDWTPQNIESLAEIYNKILNIHENQGITNTLVFGKQEKGQFSLNFVPYPRCNLIEKYQGTLHTIFGSPFLTDNQINAIKQFYEQRFVSSTETISPTKKKEKHKPRQKVDPFCRLEVINKQKIVDYKNYESTERNYTVLYDNTPKGASKSDPHFLIVPEKEAGHIDGSSVPIEQRRHMLEIAQKVMRSLPDFGTILYLERNGSKLRGVQHQHINIIGIQSFPKTVLEKIVALIRQLFLLWLPFLGQLSPSQLQQGIKKYQSTLQLL